jgi:hypothetical protein
MFTKQETANNSAPRFRVDWFEFFNLGKSTAGGDCHTWRFCSLSTLRLNVALAFDDSVTP